LREEAELAKENPAIIGVMQKDLSIHDPIHHEDVPTQFLVGRRCTQKRRNVSAGHCDASGYSVTFSNLLVNLMPKIRKGGAHHRVTLKYLLQSRMLFKGCEVMSVQGLEETLNYRFIHFRRHDASTAEVIKSISTPIVALRFYAERS
jgi:hypothetical protein